MERVRERLGTDGARASGVSRRRLLAGAALSAIAALGGVSGALAAGQRRLPNIVVIYADDLGYGDLSCYGATRIATPNIDRLARDGIRFTNGHSPSATCTPSRYALLTGEYAWRKEGAHILPGDAAALIRPGKLTLPSMLKEAGYATGVVGKWHLGLGDGKLDWNKDIVPGPLEIGFDYAHYIPATIDRVPCIYIENYRVVGLDPVDPIVVDYRNKVGSDPTGKENPDLLTLKPNDGHDGTIVGGVSRIGFMSGGKAARWSDEDMADHLTGKAVDFIGRNRDKPFFLYFATNEVHVPRLAAKRFQGKSAMGPRGDSILELDWIVGEVMAAVDRAGIPEDTLILLSSDNGPILDDGYDDEAVAKAGGHRPSGPFRSGKYSIYDGGLRVPMIARWPRRIPAGRISSALIDHVDLLATFAALTGQSLPDDAAVDSFDLLGALLGDTPHGRSFVVEDTSTVVAEKSTLEGGGDSILALVEGDWKVIKPHGSLASFHGNEIGSGPAAQLYHLASDPGETRDLALREPQRVQRMLARLASIQRAGRSRPAA